MRQEFVLLRDAYTGYLQFRQTVKEFVCIEELFIRLQQRL